MTTSHQDIVVVDTSVVSVLFNPRDYRYSYYGQRLEGYRLLISFQTVEERWFGALYGNWGKGRTKAMENHLSKFDIIWPTDTLIETCARLRSETRKAGRELAMADAWIAATAIMLGCPLASDDGDFDDIPNLPLIQRTR